MPIDNFPRLTDPSIVAPSPFDTPIGKGLIVGGAIFCSVLFPIIFYLLIWYRHPRERPWIFRTKEKIPLVDVENAAESPDDEEKKSRWKAQKRLSKPNRSQDSNDEVTEPILEPASENGTIESPRQSEDTIAVNGGEAAKRSQQRPTSPTSPRQSTATTIDSALPSTETPPTSTDGSKEEPPSAAPTRSMLPSSFPAPTFSSIFAPYRRSSLTNDKTTTISKYNNANKKEEEDEDASSTKAHDGSSRAPSPTKHRRRSSSNTRKQGATITRNENGEPYELHITLAANHIPIPTIKVQAPTPQLSPANTPRHSMVSLSSIGEVNEAVEVSMAAVNKPSSAPSPSPSAVVMAEGGDERRRSWGFGVLSPKIVDIGRARVDVFRSLRW